MENALNWLVGPDGGSFFVITFVISWQLEKWSKWNSLEKTIKELIILLATLFLGFVAIAIKQSPSLMEAIRPYFEGVMPLVLVWFSFQVAHKGDKAIAGISNIPQSPTGIDLKNNG